MLLLHRINLSISQPFVPQPPKRKQAPAGKKRKRTPPKRSGVDATAADVPPLPQPLAQQLDAMLQGKKFERARNNATALARLVHRKMDLLLDDDERDHLVECAGSDEMEVRLRNVISMAWTRQEKADKSFRLLDEAGKGVVVFEDLRRIANEFLEEEVTDEDLQEMVREIDQSGDGILLRDDFRRLANNILL